MGVGTIVVIGDKDGDIVTELRSPLGALPTYNAGKRFFIQAIMLEAQQARVAMRLKSGASQNLSGIIRLAANVPLVVEHPGEATIKGKSINDNFVISTLGDYIVPHVSGWVTGYDEAV